MGEWILLSGISVACLKLFYSEASLNHFKILSLSSFAADSQSVSTLALSPSDPMRYVSSHMFSIDATMPPIGEEVKSLIEVMPSDNHCLQPLHCLATH